ncbi:uncharacterized protein PRCAT00000892001 [Priceomyces carsonii]|uniref:uncharacterized protein n=1 Tax=Priceomyces carsonii TaxID=28549 RepID=UPI002ED9DC0A|nr:unnamed protein product [Priceomyces carsonii]
MDGNRRYAKANNLPLQGGHNAGANSLFDVLDASYNIGIKYITIYAFSIENFNRSQAEVDTLLGMLRDKLKLMSDREDSYARFNKVKICIVGNRSMIPEDILKDLEKIEEKTKQAKSGKVLNVCFPYTSRDDIAHSIRSITEKFESREIDSKDQISLQMLADNMYMGPGTPPLDILVRTSGHTRLSDFMLWQCNYNCTIEFTETLWPDFKFLGVISILLKWSYFKTMQLENQKPKSEAIRRNTQHLNSLPTAPPFASVTDR